MIQLVRSPYHANALNKGDSKVVVVGVLDITLLTEAIQPDPKITSAAQPLGFQDRGKARQAEPIRATSLFTNALPMDVAGMVEWEVR